ncbi:Lipoamide acyltransferase component of branched-chain alpha-keto acid dehydrogenase complex, mitochondrial [Erysiphe neolycopersici]|uniref:Dihydrolipoamide acetyltransferase component of pyruvate dehydrogenase complex n=1 Tax=Erysiphe neolycopersici TaxID=212602 RepID=A0A420HYJ7_9PEZI|nr:Lipoamide acyltransferase component of branched-chain alpha-keto acid dehydrogenase complex, mitochondrial [Erysiphe neolycopersici]
MFVTRLIYILPRQKSRLFPKFFLINQIHTTARLTAIKPVLLTDIGEGITECEIIQWFVKPNSLVKEWDKLCEVTSDKATVEITSRFAGVIQKLHYEAGEMAKVGKPLVDIDIQDDIESTDQKARINTPVEDVVKEKMLLNFHLDSQQEVIFNNENAKIPKLAAPAVRSLIKQLNVKIEEIPGTGKDGRVLIEDVHQFVKRHDISSSNNTIASPVCDLSVDHDAQKETILQLTSSQNLMFKSMTKSLSIPHFLYADEIDFTCLSKLRVRLRGNSLQNSVDNGLKISFLPFIIKALSISLRQYPILNARVEISDATCNPSIILRGQHNIGVAMDTPYGLLVPVIKNVSNLTVACIASELARLRNLASDGKLTRQDLSEGTITVSNIGSIGGTYVSPVIVEKEVVILGIGKVRTLPAFSASGELVKKDVCNFSWSADHRVIDGATMARAAEVVRGFLENPDSMILHLR